MSVRGSLSPLLKLYGGHFTLLTQLIKPKFPYQSTNRLVFVSINLFLFLFPISQRPCSSFGYEFVVYRFSLHASHLGKIHTWINQTFKVILTCKLKLLALQDSDVYRLLRNCELLLSQNNIIYCF